MPLNFLSTKMAAWMTILVLAVGSISIVGTIQFVKGLDGDNINGSVIACVYGACKDNAFNGGTSSGGGGGGAQPTPTPSTLIVRKQVSCPLGCFPIPPASTFKITVTGNNVSPKTFDGSTIGTKVTLDAGEYKVSETAAVSFVPSFSGDCLQDAVNSPSASGDISAGETQTCTITNLVTPG